MWNLFKFLDYFRADEEGFGVICKINYSKTIRKEKENEYYKNQESIFS